MNNIETIMMVLADFLGALGNLGAAFFSSGAGLMMGIIGVGRGLISSGFFSGVPNFSVIRDGVAVWGEAAVVDAGFGGWLKTGRPAGGAPNRAAVCDCAAVFGGGGRVGVGLGGRAPNPSAVRGEVAAIDGREESIKVVVSLVGANGVDSGCFSVSFDWVTGRGALFLDSVSKSSFIVRTLNSELKSMVAFLSPSEGGVWILAGFLISMIKN